MRWAREQLQAAARPRAVMPSVMPPGEGGGGAGQEGVVAAGDGDDAGSRAGSRTGCVKTAAVHVRGTSTAAAWWLERDFL